MSSTDYENPLFRFWCPIRNFQKKKYTAASGEKHEVTKFNGEPSQAESFFKKTKVQFARVAHALEWTKKEALYELQHEIITEGQCKLTKALKKSGVDPDDGNDEDLEDQLEEVYVYYGEELEPQGRDYAGNVVLNALSPPAMTLGKILEQ